MKVAHIADIHIQDRRRDEYAEVFTQLYAKLAGVDLILLLGDIFDNKMRVV
jgi:predicted phosphodiesterase